MMKDKKLDVTTSEEGRTEYKPSKSEINAMRTTQSTFKKLAFFQQDDAIGEAYGKVARAISEFLFQHAVAAKQEAPGASLDTPAAKQPETPTN